jgi:SAM-dependent methyltransferase
MINEAKARATRVKLYFGLTFLRASAAEIPFKDQSFDAVLSVIVLHHLEDNQWRKAFSKIVRVTKPGGTIALLEWAGASAPRVLMPLMTFRPYAQWMGLFSRENVSVQDVLGVDPVSGILASGLQNILFHAGAIVSSRRRGSGRSWTRKFKETCIWGIVTIGIVALVPIDMLCCRAFWRYATNKLFLLKKGYSHRSISAGTCPDTSTI